MRLSACESLPDHLVNTRTRARKWHMLRIFLRLSLIIMLSLPSVRQINAFTHYGMKNVIDSTLIDFATRNAFLINPYVIYCSTTLFSLGRFFESQTHIYSTRRFNLFAAYPEKREFLFRPFTLSLSITSNVKGNASHRIQTLKFERKKYLCCSKNIWELFGIRPKAVARPWCKGGL